MAKQNKFNMKEVEQKWRKALENAMVEVGNTAKNHFVLNFRKQGFDDKVVEKWKPRKKADKRAGRAILVKTGDLRRSIIRHPENRKALSVKISTDLAYAKIHNEGGVINKAESSRTINYREVSTNLATRRTQKRFASTKGKKAFRATGSMNVTIGAHQIKIPKRQFIGDSFNLNEKVIKIFNRVKREVFK